MGSSSREERSEIAFFDVETTGRGQRIALLEFGAILICPEKLVELESYSTLVRPADVSIISALYPRRNGITPDVVASAPTFLQISDRVYDLLHGRIWAGHNIRRFDCAIIREAFAEIGKPAPEPKGTIDSLQLLTQKFGRRAGDMKMDTLATYFGLREQTHRSLDDVRMNLEVLKHCATVMLLESSIRITAEEVEPNTAQRNPFDMGQLSNEMEECHLKVRFGISTKFLDPAGWPRLNFVVNAPQSLCKVLDACDGVAQRLSSDLGSSSEWWPVVLRKNGFVNWPAVRLHIPNTISGDNPYGTEMYQKDSGGVQKLVFSKYDPAELDPLFTPGTFVDALFSIDPYDYQQNAGIRLVAKKLIIHSN